MKLAFGSVACAMMLSCAMASTSSFATDGRPIRIGVLSDMSGGFSDVAGPGAVVAAKMAAEEYRALHPGRPVEILAADHQNKSDVGSQTARSWYDNDKVDAIVDIPNSAIGLAVSAVARNSNKTVLITSGVSSAFTGEQCSPNTIQYAIDNWTMANVPTTAMVQQGLDTWFFLTVDYAFGHDLERQATAALTKAGGKVVGSVRYPLGTADYSSFLLQAQSSKAKVVVLAAPNADFVSAMKQSLEFGLAQSGQRVAGLAVYISDVLALGPEASKGAIVTDSWYWGLNDQTKAFAERYAKRFQGKTPTSLHAGTYSAVWHFLKAVDALDGKSDDGRAVVSKMKQLPSEDALFGKGTIRQDGRRMVPVYVFQVKPPSQKNDVYEVLRTVDAADAYRRIEDGNCPLVSK